ncbi:uncharacterized protein LOC141587918 [Silene latifolia]|uniref:uncharacterized protein LOC141587918 n=1 Tax=Silene latifolia TaxID=37657 RepID=UPI003D770FF4
MDWKLKKFKDHVLKDLGVEVSYDKCWWARCRAKLIIYGNNKDQYAKVYDYADALRKYNPGSTASVQCEGIERPLVVFKRLYVCLNACKVGFINGCRPLLGVDGCHLKGAYPGMCLVAVGQDGNHNLYLIAWAVVEVENKDSWCWFLELLSADLGKVEGEGPTFMSDRQKGLLDALNRVVPKAEVRYYVRHMWSNFKLTWSGEVYKDTFWSAARATTEAEFKAQMKGMEMLSKEAHQWLNKIPPSAWSRHAFSTQSTSNMLLNNLCESFNNVLREVRDKPILTHMEWMRRYVMKRNFAKREGVGKYKAKFMPYAEKYTKKVIEESRFCLVERATTELFEVEYRGEFHSQRQVVRDYIDEAYSKAKYESAYAPVVLPMPGSKQWEKSGLPEPLPPHERKMPGRPSKKKRRKEVWTCKNPAAEARAPKNAGGRPLVNTEWAKEKRDKVATRKAIKEAYKAAHPSQFASQANSSRKPHKEAR